MTNYIKELDMALVTVAREGDYKVRKTLIEH